MPYRTLTNYIKIDLQALIIRTDLVEFFDCVAFNSISYDMHKQYPHLNQLFIGGLSLPLIGCWTRLNYARTQLTKIYQRMKNLPGYSWLSKLGYFSKVFTCDKTYIVRKPVALRGNFGLIKATVHTILTKNVQFTAHEITLF